VVAGYCVRREGECILLDKKLRAQGSGRRGRKKTCWRMLDKKYVDLKYL
jgi:hypothetical protein